MPDASLRGWGRKCAVAEELCHQVKQLQEEVNKLHNIQEKEQEVEQLFSEGLQPQDSQ